MDEPVSDRVANREGNASRMIIVEMLGKRLAGVKMVGGSEKTN
jgi:hypothetical protein